MADISEAVSSLELDDELYPSHHHFDFLALPGELRNQIYRLTLTTDPPRLDREHRYSCKWCTWDQVEPQNRMVDHDGQTLPGCRCWARRGLALLLANRKIHGEAAPIFWAENHFSFEGVDSFIHLVGGDLRPEYRQMIPHITIYLDPGWTDNTRKRRWDMDHPPARFWDVLFECKGLRKLEIPPYYSCGCIPVSTDMRLVDVGSDCWGRLTSELPNLKTFSWSYFGWSRDTTSIRCGPRDCVYPCRITKCLDLTVLSPEQFRRYGRFTCWDRRFGMSSCLCAFPRGPRGPVRNDMLVSTGRPDEYRCAVGMIGRQNTLEVSHPEAVPTTWTVKFSLLPLSRETIARNAMLRARDKNSKKAKKDAYSS